MRATYSPSIFGTHHIFSRHGLSLFSARRRRTVSPERYLARVAITTRHLVADLDPDELAAPTEEPLPDLPPGFGLAVISGLVEDVTVGSETDGTHVRMTWPAVDVMAPDLG